MTGPAWMPTRTVKSLSLQRAAISRAYPRFVEEREPGAYGALGVVLAGDRGPKIALRPSPIKRSTRPSYWAITAWKRARAPSMIAIVSSGSSRWLRWVEPVMSAKSAVAYFRCCSVGCAVPRAASFSRSDAKAIATTVSPRVGALGIERGDRLFELVTFVSIAHLCHGRAGGPIESVRL